MFGQPVNDHFVGLNQQNKASIRYNPYVIVQALAQNKRVLLLGFKLRIFDALHIFSSSLKCVFVYSLRNQASEA